MDHSTPSGTTASLLMAIFNVKAIAQRRELSLIKLLRSPPPLWDSCHTQFLHQWVLDGHRQWVGGGSWWQWKWERRFHWLYGLKTSAGQTPPFILPKGMETTFQECFHFPHVIGVLPEVAPDLISYPQLFEEQASGVDNGIWPGTEHVSLLQWFINLHFAGDGDQYWNFGIWASDLYFNDPSIIPSVHMWKSLYTKSKKKSQSVSLSAEPSLLKGQMCTLDHHVKAAPRSSKEATMDSTVLSSLANSKRASSTRKQYPNPTSFPDFSQDKMETSFDDRILSIHTNLFGGTVFDDPSFSARKPTP